MSKKRIPKMKASALGNASVTAPRSENFVAKHMNTFNHAVVEVDRKAQAKKNGHRNTKHKGRQDW